VEFATADADWVSRFKPTGSVTVGAANAKASDGKVARLIFSGSPGPGVKHTSEISSETLRGFGTYRARVSFASCKSTEEVVNGVFVYSYGGKHGLPLDSNANGITDNNEIDFEVLCGEPRYLWMTVWTDYQELGEGVVKIRKVTRVVDMTTGKAYQTEPGKEGEDGLGDKSVAVIPDAVIPGFATTGDFYELGFDWKSSSVRYFIMVGTKEVTLWTLDNNSHPGGASFIPQNKAFMMFNVWHTQGHWYVGGAAASPAAAATMDVDWFKFWKN
jgi:hypothetical protein